MPYMLTYAAVNYAFFALKTCEDRELTRTSNEFVLYELKSSKSIGVDDDSQRLDVDRIKSRKKSSEKDILLPDLVLSSVVDSKRANYGGVATFTTSELKQDDEVKIDFRDLQSSNNDEAYKFANISNKWISIFGVSF